MIYYAVKITNYFKEVNMLKSFVVAGLMFASSSVFAETYTFSFSANDPANPSNFNLGNYATVSLDDVTNDAPFSLTGLLTQGNLSTIRLVDSDDNVFSATKSGNTFSFSNLLAGTYQLQINVASGGLAVGTYTVMNAVTSAVPEPESLGLLLAGLGLIGFAVKRKNRI
jgi:hypothetical protein